MGRNRPEERKRIYTPELQRYVKATKKYLPGRYRLLYAMALLANNDPEKAGEHRAAFERGAERYPYPAEMDSERRLMDLVLNKVQALC